jgi:NitT/TauT family transport system substrate-binding protein
MWHWLGFAALVLLAVSSSGDPAAAQQLKKLRVTIPVPAIMFYPLYAATDKGFYAKEGYEVEIVATGGDGPDIDALIAGSVEFTVSTPNRLFTSYEQGKPLLGIMNLINRFAIDCAMNKDVAAKLGITAETPLDQRLKSLKGLTVAGTRPGAFTYLMLVNYAKRAGLVPQQDVQIIGVGGPGSMLPALENAQVAVACTGSPLPELAVEHGKGIMFTNNIGGTDPDFDEFLFNLVFTRPDFAQKEPETVRGFLRALLAAVKYAREAPGAEQLPLLQKHFSGISDQLMLQILDKMRPAYKADGKITATSVEKAGKFLIDAGVVKGQVPWDKVTSNEYLPR